MNKNAFIENPQTKSFIGWLKSIGPKGNIKAFCHEWTARSNKVQPKVDDVWRTESLYQAFEGYFWRSKHPQTGIEATDFAGNECILNDLGVQLRQAIGDADAKRCANLCEDILRWGGVAQWSVAVNLRAIIRNAPETLPDYLKKIITYLSGQDYTAEFQFDEGNLAIDRLEIDSGTTKIYSLLTDELIIYDGRVGAALGFLVSQWCDVNHYDGPPEHLRFPWGYNKSRNPNKPRSRTFPMFSPEIERLRFTYYASWLVNELIGDEAGFKSVRQVEAALFMLGYCVCDCVGDKEYIIENEPQRDKYPRIDLEERETPTDKRVVEMMDVLKKGLSSAHAPILVHQQHGDRRIAITVVEAGIEVDTLGTQPFVPWAVYEETLALIVNNKGESRRGDAMNCLLGDEGLALDSVEGHVAHIVYEKQLNQRVFRRISVIANVLVHVGLCEHGVGVLRLTSQWRNRCSEILIT